MATLTISGLSKTYDGRQPVLRDIDLSVNDGEFVVLVGPSGCGKSTLLRLVAGLEAVTTGEIAIGSRVVNALEPKARDVAMVFQNYALYPHMSVEQNIAYGLKIRGVPAAAIRERVQAVAAMLELGPLLARRPRELSGGQRQRVAMGRAMVREPALFLFDEPLSNLDAKLRAQMRVELRRLHARLRTTSLYVTHDQIEAMTLAQRVVVLNEGRIEQVGSPAGIYERPASTFVASFMGAPAMNLLRGRVSAGGHAFEIEDGPRVPLEGVRELGTTLAPQREYVLGVRPEHASARDGGFGAAGAHVPLTVDFCEMLGADNLAYGSWGRQSVAVRLPHDQRPETGTVLELSIPVSRLHFFDAASGRRVETAAP
ncbi:sn-glycerol-3-phosphate ABC transporter ATP-binding protein UgpC [Burkholderia sp. WAC0059]|uniref:sn-glycerol-3-phosphate import ATP-binding protein UgpC n=1 Tax=Burkholderia sp. WAC0059 TaxID=2066022 RepID=UPI000C7F2716|nr:sn-glycerol-3-phosphate import ATP-binding protein UgpC [Burkholderia sp. WAC0059]PLZ00902.1 sn-glycerol-3-phosphate ABC transporter ATP-binding protein UgpC [Burkholderia sp. WAC0059]